MIYVMQLDDGRLIDAEYPEGTDVSFIEAEARKEFKMNARHYDPAKQPKAAPATVGEPPAVTREIERLEAALAREIKKADGLRNNIEVLRTALAEAEHRATDAKHGKAEAIATGKNDAAKLYACEQALEQERKARAKADAAAERLRADAQKIREAPEPRRIAGWAFEVISRDANGFTREVRMIPEYEKVTVQ